MTSQTTAKILKLLDNTDISGRYRVHLNTYRTGHSYAKLAYHNVGHVSQVLNLFEVLRKLSGQHFSKIDLKRVELALAFHDADHNGHPDSVTDDEGKRNIHRAIEHFQNWAARNNIAKDEQDIVAAYIAGTEFPITGDFAGHPAVVTELVCLMRDADCLWGMMPGNAEMCMLGLWAERRNVGLEPDEIDILKVLTNQVKFLGKYEPWSGAGRTFRNAMADVAAEAFAMVAMEYQRQIMAADAVQAMSDDEVLALRDSMKREVRKNAEGIDVAATYPTTQKVTELLPGESAAPEPTTPQLAPHQPTT